MKSRDTLLQPVSAGDIIDRALRIYRAHIGQLITITAAPGLIAVLGGLLAVFAGPTLLLAVVGQFLTYGLATILNLMILGALTRVVADHIIDGTPVTLGATWHVVRRNRQSLMGAAIVGWLLLPITIGLVVLVGMIVVGVVGGLSALLFGSALRGPSQPWLVVLPIVATGTTVLFMAGLLFLEVYGRAVMMAAAAVIENLPSGQAIHRGLKLGARNSPTVLAILAFEYCLSWSIAIALAVFLGIDAVVAGLSFEGVQTETMALAFNILLQFGNLLAAPVAAVAFPLLYFDNRVRKEGLDVELLAQDVSMPSPTPNMTDLSVAGGVS